MGKKEQRNFFCGSDVCFMAVKGSDPDRGLFGTTLYGLNQLWKGRMTADESLIALPRPVYLQPPPR